MNKIYHISMEATLDVISGKWKPVIMCHLGGKTLRNGELMRRIPTISQRILTKQLREMEDDHLIERKVYDETPPKVEYSLTEEGNSLREILVAMSEWGESHVNDHQKEGKQAEILNHNIDGFLNMK